MRGTFTFRYSASVVGPAPHSTLISIIPGFRRRIAPSQVFCVVGCRLCRRSTVAWNQPKECSRSGIPIQPTPQSDLSGQSDPQTRHLHLIKTGTTPASLELQADKKNKSWPISRVSLGGQNQTASGSSPKTPTSTPPPQTTAKTQTLLEHTQLALFLLSTAYSVFCLRWLTSTLQHAFLGILSHVQRSIAWS